MLRNTEGELGDVASSPTISIVVPAFDAYRTIAKAVESVLAQTYRSFELIVCDDASTDKTEEVVLSFSDERIRVLQNAENLGEGPSRDKAIEVARGEWIAVLDADDAWRPERLENLLKAANSDKDVMVFDDIWECHHSPDGLVPWKRMRGSHAFGAHGGAVDVPVSDWACCRRLLIKPLIPAEALRRSGVVHSSRRFGADTEFFLKLLANGLKLRYVPEAYYRYRIAPGSMTSLRTRSKHMQEILRNAIVSFADEPAIVTALRKRLKWEDRNGVYSEFVWALKDHRFNAALKQLLSHPWIILEFVGRVAREVPYHFHRLWHHGSGRGYR